MTNQPYIDYRFKFAAVNCARIVPQLRGLPNMLGEPLDAYGQPLFNPDYEPSFYGARIGEDVYIAFRSKRVFGRPPELIALTEHDVATIFGVWA